MDQNIALEIFESHFGKKPESVKRCETGQGNFVYIMKSNGLNYILRCSEEKGAYKGTIYWLTKLSVYDIPIPEILAEGRWENVSYLILTYLEGEDLGIVYPSLSDSDKKEIAREIIRIQNEVSKIKLEKFGCGETWKECILNLLERSRSRIVKNGYFDPEKVDRLFEAAKNLEDYFNRIEPVAYLDDISSKNLLIKKGRICGVIDIDWIGTGDRLTFAALTKMALLDFKYDTKYVEYLLEEMKVNEEQKAAFTFYTLMFCADFMGERGMCFTDKKIAVNADIVDKLNGIYDGLWKEYSVYL